MKLATIHPFSVVEARSTVQRPRPKSKVDPVSESEPTSIHKEPGHDRIVSIIEEAQKRAKKRQSMNGLKRKGALGVYTKVLFQIETQQERGQKLDKRV